MYVDAAGKPITAALEYETLWSMGAMTGIDDLDAIARLDFLCDDTGLDTMNTGVALAVAMEKFLAKQLGGRFQEDVRPQTQQRLDEIFEEKVEDSLMGPMFVIDYSESICPLTKRKAGRPEIAERFELFIAGMEMANAYTELNDPDLQGEDLLVKGELAVEKVLFEVIENLEAPEPLAALCLGIAGVGQQGADDMIREVLRRLGQRQPTRVVNDALVALVAGAAHGPGESIRHGGARATPR